MKYVTRIHANTGAITNRMKASTLREAHDLVDGHAVENGLIITACRDQAGRFSHDGKAAGWYRIVVLSSQEEVYA